MKLPPVLSRSLLAATVALTAAPALAQDPVSINGAWSRASIGTSRPGVLYLDITNTGDAQVTLTGLETDVAAMPEIHRSATDAEGVSTMAPAGNIKIAPGETVSLEPGGLHGMLMKLQQPLKEGDSFDATLIFRDAGAVEISVPVLAMTATGPEAAE